MLLKDKVAVVYGAGGAIGGAVARALAAEGARLYLTGRSREPVELVAKDIASAGGFAEVAQVDALDGQAVDGHLHYVTGMVAGRVDISFNAVGIAPSDPVPLTELDAERFCAPVMTYATSYFLTARAAARHMVPKRSGVIMTVTALHARVGLPMAGGYGPAMAAKEALTRQLSAELAPQGIRVVGLRPQGMPETRTLRQFFQPRAKSGMTWEQFQELGAGRTHPRRLMMLAELANAAVFLASGKASGLTGTTVNLTMGTLDD